MLAHELDHRAYPSNGQAGLGITEESLEVLELLFEQDRSEEVLDLVWRWLFCQHVAHYRKGHLVLVAAVPFASLDPKSTGRIMLVGDVVEVAVGGVCH